MKTNSSITVYNKYKDPLTRSELYKRTPIVDVQWQNSLGSNVRSTGGQMAADQAAIFIPFERGDSYKSPRVWQALVDKSTTWTLQVGDIVVRGIVADEITGAFTVSRLAEKYDDVLVISSVDQMDSGSMSMRHWEIGAK